MLVFNLVAVPILLVVAALGAGLGWLFPSVFGGAYQELTYSVLAIVIGGLAEAGGLRGRLFFLPIWLIGGGVLAWQLWELFGVAGLVAGVTLLAALLAVFAVIAVSMLHGQEREKEKRLEEARALLSQGKPAEARQALADAWVVPAFASTDAVRAQHLLSVLALVDAHAPALGLSADAIALSRGVRRVLAGVAAGGKPVAFSDEPATMLHAMGFALSDAERYTMKDDVREQLGKVG